MTRYDVEIDVLSENNHLAQANREMFARDGIIALNILSSPGSGKTTLLERTISDIGADVDIYVVEGDQQTENDALRIKESGAPAVQINTRDGCHLEAGMIGQAYDLLKPKRGGLFIIENVGNLVCPAMFDLGETARVVVVSVTEGEDKPLKYPNVFLKADVCLINKVDLLPYLEFNLDMLKKNITSVNPRVQIIETSKKNSNEGWYTWLKQLLASRRDNRGHAFDALS